MICVAVTYVIQPGHEEEAIGFYQKLTELTREEDGCLFYLVHRSTTNPRQFFIYEQYEDQAALDAHRAAPHFTQYAVNGLYRIIESRTPDTYITLSESLEP